MITQARGADAYLDLLKKVLTNVIYQDPALPCGLLRSAEFDPKNREEGKDWPATAHTMIGQKRLDNLHACLDRVLTEEVPGDLIETGVWRGGACIFMRAFLHAHDRTDRTVWVADSFQGIPVTTERSAQFDHELALHTYNDVLAVDLETVRDNFARYGLLDDQVQFLAGWFADTLPSAPIDRLAILRLDGDLYESTLDTLDNLYRKVSVGGFVIVDDYALPGCRDAVHEFRGRLDITDIIEPIDEFGAYWRRTV